MSRKITDMHPFLQVLCLKHMQMAADAGVPFIVTQTLRTQEEQQFLFAKGRTAPGEPCYHNGIRVPVGSCQQHPLGVTVTKAEPGNSYHEYGLAYDVALVDKTTGKPHWKEAEDANFNTRGDFTDIGEIGEQIGLEWGGRWTRFPDMPHFQYRGGLTLADLKGGKTLPDINETDLARLLNVRTA